MEDYFNRKRKEWIAAPKDDQNTLGMSFEVWLCYSMEKELVDLRRRLAKLEKESDDNWTSRVEASER